MLMTVILCGECISQTFLFNLLVTILGEAYISILVQPMEKFRFRYKSEMVGTHGSLLGVFNGRKRNKNNVPTVKVSVLNFNKQDYQKICGIV